MWRSEIRNLFAMEKVWISRLGGRWSEDYLSSIQVREFETDNAHTIRNVVVIDGTVSIFSSELTNDDDGAAIEVVLYETGGGDFGELEFSRLDTRRLMMISKIKV